MKTQHMLKQSVKLTPVNAMGVALHAAKNRHSINLQANIAVEEWLKENRKQLKKGPRLNRNY